MKKVLYIILFILPLALCAGCQKQDDIYEKQDDSPIIIPENANIDYFGFALTDCNIDDPFDNEKKTNYLDEVDEFVNIADIYVDSLDNLSDRIDFITAGDNKVLIHISALFVETVKDKHSPTGVKYQLIPNYKELFHSWANNQSFDESDIAAFILPDEPAWNNMNMEDLLVVSQTLKEYYPSIPIMVIEASPSASKLVIDDSIDLYGFDQYGTLNPLQNKEYQKNLVLLKEKLSESQNLVIIIECQWLSEYQKLGYEQDILIDVAKNYYTLASNEAKAKILLCYLLPGGFDNPEQKGFRNLDENVQNIYKEIGKSIIDK